MSDARTRLVLQTIAVHTVNHCQTAGLAVGALAVVALAIRYGGLAGVALLIALMALAALGVATTLWLRLRATEQSHAALALTVVELTTRLERIAIEALGWRSGPLPQPLSGSPARSPAEAASAPQVPGEGSSIPDRVQAVHLKIALDLMATAALPVPTAAIPSEVAAADGAMPDAAVVDMDSSVVFDAVSFGTVTSPEPGSHHPDADVAVAHGPVLDVRSAADASDHESTGTSIDASDHQHEALAHSAPVEDPDNVVQSGTLALSSGPDSADDADHADTPPSIPESVPTFTLKALNGEAVTHDVLTGTPAVVVFWRPGCQHCQRLTPELVAWESLQGPRLIVFAACDGPTAFRAGLPGLVILDPGFTVGQAIGAPGTPAALPLDVAGRPSGPVVAGASAVTTLLLDAMRDWASVETELLPQLSAIDMDEVAQSVPELEMLGEADKPVIAAPTVLLRRVKEIPAEADHPGLDWDAESFTRRAG